MAHSTTEVVVRVLARWVGTDERRTPWLLVSVAARVREFRAVAHGRPEGGALDAWLATFLVPIELRAYLLRGLRMRIGALEVGLPAAQTGTLAAEPPAVEVSDRVLLAERRARRAELAEESLGRRAAAAEAQAQNLERQLEHLEERLLDATAEHKQLRTELEERERDLKSTRQREYAEQQLRVQSEEHLHETERAARAEVERLLGLLTATERDAATISAEMEQVRREGAEALNHARVIEHAAGERARAAAAEREEHVAQVLEELDALRAEVAEVRHEMASLETAVDRASRRQLDSEQQLRAELAHERGSVSAQLARAETRLHDQITEQRQRFELRVATVRESVAELEARLERAVPAEPAAGAGGARASAPEGTPAEAAPGVEAQQLIDDLTQAAEGLRGRVPAVAAPEDPETGDVGEAVERPEGGDAPIEPEPVEVQPVGVQRRTTVPWLATAIDRLAELGEPDLAARLILELLPGQAARVTERVRYRLEIDELGSRIVTIENRQVEIADPGDQAAEAGEPGEQAEVDFSIAGPVSALGALVGGGASRRLRGCEVSDRRRVRRFMRPLRDPIGLAELADAGVDVTPTSLVRALSAAVDPRWTEGHSFSVRYRVQGGDGESVRVEARDGAPLRVTAGEDGEAAATVEVERAALLAALGGLPLAAERRPVVSGDTDAATMLTEWYTRAQGLSAA